MRPNSDFGAVMASFNRSVQLLPYGILTLGKHKQTFESFSGTDVPQSHQDNLSNDDEYQILIPSARSLYVGLLGSLSIRFLDAHTLSTCISIEHEFSGYKMEDTAAAFLFGFTFALQTNESTIKVWLLLPDEAGHNPGAFLQVQDAIFQFSILHVTMGMLRI